MATHLLRGINHRPKQYNQEAMNYNKYIELGARWYVFVFLNVYGIGKIVGGQFYRKGNLPADIAAKTLDTASNFELAWTFMGYSFFYILFIGIAEIVGAWLLLWEKTKLLGVAILFPILVNIIVFDFIFLDAYGALASAIIYFSLLLIILYINRVTVIHALLVLTQAEPTTKKTVQNKLKTILIVLLLMALLFGLDQSLVNFFGHGKG
jgi:hypothetical protein